MIVVWMLLATMMSPAWVQAQTGEYEVDYEEEGEGVEIEEAPEKPVPASGKKTSRESSAQGSRALNRFQPVMKSEQKSKYMKEGRALDVDSD